MTASLLRPNFRLTAGRALALLALAAPAGGAWAQGVPATATDLNADEQAMASHVQVGTLACEFKQSVQLQPNQDKPGHFHLTIRNRHFDLRPVLSSTGAVRLEDKAQGAVWIQLANKSMLMDQKVGRRMADECQSPQQLAVAEQFKLNPPPNLLEVAQAPRIP